jgi:hypothetical protein
LGKFLHFLGCHFFSSLSLFEWVTCHGMYVYWNRVSTLFFSFKCFLAQFLGECCPCFGTLGQRGLLGPPPIDSEVIGMMGVHIVWTFGAKRSLGAPPPFHLTWCSITLVHGTLETLSSSFWTLLFFQVGNWENGKLRLIWTYSPCARIASKAFVSSKHLVRNCFPPKIMDHHWLWFTENWVCRRLCWNLSQLDGISNLF